MTLFELAAKITLDQSEFDKGIDGIGGKLKSVGSSIKSGVSTLAKIGVAGIGAAASAVGVLAKKSIDGYAEYQQMVGGVQKLYGNMGMSLEDYAKSVGKSTDEVKDKWTKLGKAQETVLKNADNAYKTSGMSANQYMNVATSFSASLIKSLNGDTEKAAKLTDTAMKSISDNWNTFGGDLGMIQSAYQGFAKQNYMMLDNLKLGYGGTKTEMEKLIKDANEYGKATGQASDLSIDSFADIVTAIDLIQQKQQIAGTTAREANSTIEGSVNSLKAAWDNLVAGFANPDADISTLMQNVVTTAGTAASNILPAFMQAIEGIGQAITEMMPVVTENIPKAFDSVLAPLIETGAKMASSLLTGLLESLPDIASTLSTELPNLINSAMSSISNLGGSLSGLFGGFDLGGVTSSIAPIVESLSTYLSEFWQFGMDAVGQIGQGLIEGIPTLVEMIPEMLEMVSTGLMDAMGSFTEMIVPLMEQFGAAMQENIPILLENVLPMIEQFTASLRENAGKLVSAGIDMILKIAQGIIQSIPTLISYIPQIVINIVGIINDNAPKLLAGGLKLILMLGKGIIDAIPTLVANIPKIFQAILAVWEAINWVSLGTKVITFIKNGLAAAPSAIGNALKSAGKAAWNAFKSINWLQLGKSVISFLKNGITGAGKLIWNALKTIGKTAVETFKKIKWLELGKNIINGIVNGLKAVGSKIGNFLMDLAKGALNKIKKFFGIASPSKVMRDQVGKQIGMGMALGIKDAESDVNKAMAGLSNDMSDADILGSLPVDAGSIDVTGGIDPTASSAMTSSSNTYIFNITNNVDGAENPEDFAERLVRQLRMEMRTA